MGINFDAFPVYNGAATLNAYGNIRNIRTTKEDTNFLGTPEESQIEYKLEADGFVSTNNGDTIVKLYSISKVQETPFIDNLWDTSYATFKEILTNENISFTDNI